MCWNETVSLNTFVFSSFVLLLIIYNNSYTKYKIRELNNKWMYAFIASFVFMQLTEFFIWRNINNKFYNNLFSTVATCLLIVQPALSIMILSETHLRNILLFSYLLLALPYSIYKFYIKRVYTVVSESGHLTWKFFDVSPFISAIWFFFFSFSFFYEKNWVGIGFGFIALLLSFLNYYNDQTMWSMWCWVVNSVMIYYAVYLLMFLPFYEKCSIC